ncbi:MAG: hypothetical protein HOI95_09940, partial [Chromatiales bacterium]|nr:hypothetical protein [Chromatiales bacterium]
MTFTVGLFAAARQRLASRIDALDLDINLVTFDGEGRFDMDGGTRDASDVELDYLWIGPDLAGGDFGALPFDVALKCKRIGV